MIYRLGIDLGTTYTAAAVAPDAEAPSVVGLGDRSLQVPSVLFLLPDGSFLIGEAADRRGALEPDRLVREFKRRLGDSVPMIVAGQPYSPEILSARMLRWVVDRTSERMGGPPSELVVTHPANWGPYKLDLLEQAAELADLGRVHLYPEPQAAAAQYAAKTHVAAGDKLAVYDLGGGTFDVCVLEKTHDGFALLGKPEGVEHLGGVDIDHALIQLVLGSQSASLGGIDMDDPALAVHLARIRRDCVDAKEALSTDVDAVVPIVLPGLESSFRLTRSELESLIRPILLQTVEAVRRALRSASAEPTALSALVLVGGSSRIPLVSEVLQGAFNVPVALDVHPKHDVVLGAVRVDVNRVGTNRHQLTMGSFALGSDVGDVDPLGNAVVEISPAKQRAAKPSYILRDRRRLALIAVSVALVVAVTGAIILSRPWQGPVSRPSQQSGPAGLPVASEPLSDSVFVWSTRRDGNWGIDLGDVTTKTVSRQLLSGPNQDDLPVISPDRRTIAYLRWSAPDTYRLRVISADGHGDREFFTEAPAGCVSMLRPAWSVNDQLALPCRVATGETLLNLVNPDGTVVRRIDQGNLGDPTFTTDGQSVIYWLNLDGTLDGGALFQTAIDGGFQRKQLTRGLNGQDNDPACSPDGTRVAFRRTAGQHRSIAVLSFGSTEAPHMLTMESNDQDPSWSPDSAQIIFKRGPDENADLYLMSSVGGTARALISDDQPDAAPSWTAR